MATLTSTAALTLRWSFDDELDLSTIRNVGNLRKLVTIDDSAICNRVWADARTLAANTVETLDLSNLAYDVMGLAGTFSFSRIHKIYIANVYEPTVTAPTAEIRVGVPDNLTIGHYAMGVWQQSYSFLYSAQGWVPGDLLRVANASSISIPYHIVLLGQGAITSA